MAAKLLSSSLPLLWSSLIVKRPRFENITTRSKWVKMYLQGSWVNWVTRWLVSSFTVIGGGMKNLKESIRRWVFFFDSGAASKRYFHASWRTVNRTALVHSRKMVGSNTVPGLLSKYPYLDHTCLCRGTTTPPVYNFGQLFTNIGINTKTIAA